MSSAHLPEVEAALEEAERLRQAGNYREGIALLVSALQFGEKTAQIYFRLGNIYYDSHDLDRAEYAYKKAIEHDPAHVSAHHNLAVVYRKQGRISEYVKQRKQALRLAGRHPERVQLSEEQARRVKRLALRLFLFGLGLVVAVLLLSYLLGRG
ncbi:MAG: tetratricopeptide repeat protein [Candidatus Acetothermia bacterium]|jgi:tetratricopeptide (TPR) repeat protein|nr:tetratricopeptide repeat protein [Candidatus Acetothermia bacterium]MDH7504861.1 tetratricopeptide repeat protein [Candidatus Acetothermia bacterium]